MTAPSHLRPPTPAPSPINVLRSIAAPRFVIHVGAGSGHGEMHQWRQWNVDRALIVDADVDRLAWAQPHVAGKPGWHARGGLLAETDGEADFHRATNPDEDGLIAPEHLRALWPNLHTAAHDRRVTRRLDELLSQTDGSTLDLDGPVWIIVDCLPALPILKGAGAHLDHSSVLWLRVLLQPVAGVGNDSLLESTEEFLEPLGFRCVHVSESNHPAVGHALFCRDWQAILQPRIEAATRRGAELAKAQGALAEERTVLTEQCESLRREFDSLAKAHSALAEEKTAQTAECQALRREVGSLTRSVAQTLEQHGRLSMERQSRINDLTATIDAMRPQVDHWTKTLEEYSKAAEASDAAAKEREDQFGKRETHFAEAEGLLKAQVQDLEAQVQEIEARAQEREAQLADAGRLLKAQVQELEAQVREREAHRARLEAEFSESWRSLRAEVARLEQALAESTVAIASTNAAAMQRDAQHAKRESELLESEVALKVRVGQLEASLEEHSRVRHSIEAAARDRDAAFAKREAEMSESDRALRARIVTLEQSLEEHSRSLQVKDATAKEREEHFAKLEAESTEMERRQRGITEEMIRAGAQIDLIKDILVHGETVTMSAGAREPVTTSGGHQKRYSLDAPRKRRP